MNSLNQNPAKRGPKVLASESQMQNPEPNARALNWNSWGNPTQKASCPSIAYATEFDNFFGNLETQKKEIFFFF